MRAVVAHARFYLLFTDQPTGFDLMAECTLCGAMTEQPLVVAWEMRHVACSNCGSVMRMDDSVLARLRKQAVVAQATIDRLESRTNKVPITVGEGVGD